MLQEYIFKVVKEKYFILYFALVKLGFHILL